MGISNTDLWSHECEDYTQIPHTMYIHALSHYFNDGINKNCNPAHLCMQLYSIVIWLITLTLIIVNLLRTCQLVLYRENKLCPPLNKQMIAGV